MTTKSGNVSVEIPTCQRCGEDKYTTMLSVDKECFAGPEGPVVIRTEQKFSVTRCVNCGEPMQVAFVEDFLSLFCNKETTK